MNHWEINKTKKQKQVISVRYLGYSIINAEIDNSNDCEYD